MTNNKLTNGQAIGVLDVLWSNPLFGETHRQAFEIGIKAIKALEQEPCEDAISRKQAVYITSGFCHPANVADELAKLPSVTPKQRTGHWIKSANGYFAECDKCGLHGDYGTFKHWHYCPNCGAKMEEKNGKG